MSDLPPLPPGLQSLFADERDAPGGSDAARARIHGRLVASLGLVVAGETAVAAATTTGTASAGTVTAITGITGKLVALVLAIGAIGGGAALVYRGTRSSSVVAAAVVERSPDPRVAPIAPVIPPPAGALVAPTSSPALARPRAARMPTAPAVATPAREESQRQLLSRAMSAVATADLPAALELVERDARIHANGALAEERDAIHVDVLLRLWRYDEARELARTFAARYPTSVHRPVIDRALVERP